MENDEPTHGLNIKYMNINQFVELSKRCQMVQIQTPQNHLREKRKEKMVQQRKR